MSSSLYLDMGWCERGIGDWSKQGREDNHKFLSMIMMCYSTATVPGTTSCNDNNLNDSGVASTTEYFASRGDI